ncbi:MAG: nicotinate-nucleotide adenylyltransferase [bacterium]
MRIGIIGGTFDPPHNGHLYMAEELKKLYKLDKVMFIPAGRPPHKTGRLSAGSHRYKMLKLAVGSQPYFLVSDIELKKAGKSFTFDTLQLLKKKFGSKTEIFFMVGADSILEITTWKNYQELLKLYKFIVVVRPGYDLSGLDKNIAAKVVIAKIKGLAISSSDIRERLKEGLPITYFVPEKVEEYIHKHKLYT